ncbi:MAG: glutamine--fructose-6-phosphate transaminase (isomerizing) [Candidatus Marinimicrobia bacterium]|nr:glutamine--fructose-6-phosphate transaminase (isomerizing) [Candidatus Neomarinimicrobiota bacterium]
MCGIIGYIGKRNALPILIEGIKRLEYRGYDSSGVSIIDKDNELITVKEKGQVVDLERKISSRKNLLGNVGISHTRWATHGEPNKENAHPHNDYKNRISLVHNGIIENYKTLKDKLIKEGIEFKSETDSEVLVNLISWIYEKENDIEVAIREALQNVEGTFGIAVIDKNNPEQIIAARRGSPLILGIGKNEFFITSDVTGTIIHTKKVIYLKDNEMVKINRDDFVITTLDNTPVDSKISIVDWDISNIDKGKYSHFMLKEIYEQVETVENAFRGRIIEELSTTKLGGISISASDLRKIKKVQIIACGTSWHSALVGKALIEKNARISVDVEYASEYRYNNPIIPDDTLVFVISQSGETADTLGALREVKARGAKVMGITNVVGSTIARETDGGIYIYAGTEIGVASTKAFTSQVTILSIFSILLGRMKNLSPNYGNKFINSLRELPQLIKQTLKLDNQIKKIAESIKDSTNALYLGRGIHFPLALEGALKLKEISYIHAEGYPAAEMKHGPIALIDENMPVIAINLNNYLHDKMVSNLEEVKARKGRIITIATEGDNSLDEISEFVIKIPKCFVDLQPILVAIPLQLLAYHVAVLKNLDPDKPRNLAKSVTVE